MHDIQIVRMAGEWWIHRFIEKTVLVTGTAHGVGLATVIRLAQEGASVVFTDVAVNTVKNVIIDDLAEDNERLRRH